MKTKMVNESEGFRTFVAVFETGEAIMEPLHGFLRAESIQAAQITGIGALQSVTLGYFNWETKQYDHHEITSQVELLSLAGDVALSAGEPQVHAHVVVGLADTTTRGGHLVDGRVRPTLELIVRDVPTYLQKRVDEQSGLALIAPEL